VIIYDHGRHNRHFFSKNGNTSTTCKYWNGISFKILQKATPDNASGLMSMLPSGLNNMFSDEEKTQFTTTQQNVPQEQFIDKLSNQCCNGDKQ